MLILKIIVFLLGLAFALFGYLIFFKNKYSLINGFEAQHKAKIKTEEYAKRVGQIEFIIGIALLTIDIILVIFV